MTVPKKVQLLCVVSVVREKSLQEPFSFTDYGDVTETYTDHAHMETVKEDR